MIPGEYFLRPEDVSCNVNRKTCKVTVVNTGDRPVQVGSHYQFFEVNKQLEFDKQVSFGMRLNIPAGTAIRFEPGEEKEVELVEIAGNRNVYGFNLLINGHIDNEENKTLALKKASENNFKSTT